MRIWNKCLARACTLAFQAAWTPPSPPRSCSARGAKATGVFIKGWYPPGMPCTWAEDRRDAMRVAARLGIPFITLDASAEYKKSVIDYLLAEYAAGRTPNPDIMCNREVKFGAFWRFCARP